jgi:molecular chaperone HscC
MPCFVELVARTFGRMPSRTLPPDEAVAMGAAVQAGLKQGDQAVDDLVVTDVAPFSLGIASATKFGERHVEGIFSPIIDRGTVIPVSRSELFRTIADNQKHIVIEVYQGEHSLCRQTLVLEQRPGTLSRKQIEQARDAMKRLKFHPREALPNRTALARSDALYAELTGDARQQLGAMIAAFHGALASQQPGEIQNTREQLVSLTDALRRVPP